MILSHFFANDIDVIFWILLEGGIYMIIGVLLCIRGISSFFVMCDHIIQKLGSKIIRNALSILVFLVYLGLLVFSIYIPIWVGEQRGFVIAAKVLYAIGWVLILPDIVSALIEEINRGKIRISKKELRENPHLLLNARGVYSIAKIIRLDEISPQYYWITYEFLWKGRRYTNRIARYKTKRNGAFEIYEQDCLFFVLLMKKNPSNNILTENLVPQTRKLTLTEEDVPKNGWKRREYMQFIEQ
ncbi:hypothetical protein CLV62_102160 [Dysgonomonas alginatilytica]|uniref:Uncharacterized protein n=1 Tax=Dysgonomonas alginatilytica TaxID=1605892 RepID=A0A2V3PVL2_9BACT|nr:hypothetical protein [Dysgonomonas alginatilytica]PXV68128.1 hypothetical protein CLV62_102160 [Dysgonomonas alginatilytica]